MSATKDFLFGFIMAIAISAGIVVLLTFLVFGFEAPSGVKQSMNLALTATMVVLLYAGAEIAGSFLFSWNTPMGVKFMHFLGAVSAVALAYFVTPLILEAPASTSENECRIISKTSIGAFTFSKEECDD